MIEGLPVLGLGQSGVLLLVVLMVLTDRLVWHKRLDLVQKQLDAANETNVELMKQNTLMLESAIPTVDAVLRALHEAAEGERP